MAHIGNTGLIVVSEERVFDERTGFQTLVTYEGEQAAVESAMGLLSTFRGLKMNSRHHEGPVYRLNVGYAGTSDGSEEDPVDTWSRVVEFAQEDIRQNPLVIAMAGGEEELAFVVKYVKEAIRDGKSLDTALGAPALPWELAIYDLYARGAEAYEVRRIVVRRRRVIPVNFAQPTTVGGEEVIYTTAQMIARYGVPVAFQALLPGQPDTAPPGDSMWGWRERANTTDFVPSINKTEETIELVHAAWSTILYAPYVP